MGTLAQGFGFGSAGGAAGSSLQWGAAGAGISATGDLLSGLGRAQMAQYQSQVAANNALIMQRNAQAAISAGSYAESSSKLRTGMEVGQERAAQGANNVDVNVGSPLAVQNSTRTVGAMDAAMIHYNAAREAYGLQTEAASQTAQSKLDKMAGQGALAGSLFTAGSTLLSGASSLSSKWAQYQLSGAQPAGG